MAPSREVATQRSAMPEFYAWIDALAAEAAVTETEDNEAFDPSAILQRILTADSFEDAVNEQNSSLMSGKALVDIVHTINDFKIRKSDDKFLENERSLGVYAVVHAQDEEGTEFTYGVGAANVLAILWQANKFKKIPGKFVLKGRDTRNGTLLSLMPLKTAVKGDVQS